MQSKFKKAIFSILLILIMIIMAGQNVVYAASGKFTYFTQHDNYDNGVMYMVEGTTNGYFYKIADADNNEIRNFYCLSAGKNLVSTVTYNNNYTIDSSIDNALMWIFDHMYIEDAYYTGNGTNKLTVDQLLENAGIVPDTDNDNILYCNGWYYGTPDAMNNKEGYIVDNNKIKISEAEVKVAQQAAIWYFTNYKVGNDSNFNVYIQPNERMTMSNISWLKAEGSDGNPISTVDYLMREEQIAILCNYFIENALIAENNGYTSPSVTTPTLEFNNNTVGDFEDLNTKYRVGPLKIETTGDVDILSIVAKKGNTQVAVTYLDENKQEIAANSIPVNKDFYVDISKDDMTGTVTLQVEARGMATTRTFWSANGYYQPVVEYSRVVTDLDDEIVLTYTPPTPVIKMFDLALRKEIYRVNNSTDFSSEKATDAKRENIYDNDNNIKNKEQLNNTVETCTYNHRKDPVIVKEGETVTYRIYIYNEGEIDGYASKIVDKLASGLELDSSVPGTISSDKGNIYTVNYDDTNNEITFTLQTLDDNGVIKAYDKDTKKLDRDYIEVKCKVTQKAETDGKTRHYLSNVAYIAEAYKVEENVATKVDERDRNNTESSPDNITGIPNQNALNVTDDSNNYETLNGKIYHGSTNNNIFNNTSNTFFAGQEDDDDFETVVVLPKVFDLALRKFITKISENDVTTRIPEVIYEDGKITYDHPKDVVKVKVDDIVIYTLRVFNEGEIDGYAKTISDDIPEYLEFLPDHTINEEYGWKMYKQDETETNDVNEAVKIKTDYTSTHLLEAFNPNAAISETNPAHIDVKVAFKVKDPNSSKYVIINKAQISDDADENGNPVDDIDSIPDEWNPEEDDQDYENVSVEYFDLALRKFISKVSTDGNFEDTTTTTSYDREPVVDLSKLNTLDDSGKLITTAIYEHSKEPILLNVGDYVLYTIRVYNEGDIDGYAKEITDYLPEYLDFVDGTAFSDINSNWTYDAGTRQVKTKENAPTTRKLLAYDETRLDSEDVKIVCKVNANAIANQNITNFAKITKYADDNNNPINPDIDSHSDDDYFPEDLPTYKDGETGPYIPGFEDDDDFEKVVVRGPGKYDLILIKEDENGEDLNSKATFEVNGETKEVTGRLIIADDVVINASNVNTPDVYTIKETIPPDDYSTFDGIIKITVNKKIDGNTYVLDGQPVWDVIDKDGNSIDKKDADVHLENGNIYVEVVDHEKKDFDLALRKFITNISENDVTSRIPSVSYKDGKITYTHPKDVVKVHVDDIITYTLRVFNEGELDGYAEKISDDIPEYLEFLPDNETNKAYKWVMLDKDEKVTTDVKEAVKIMTDYTSKENETEKGEHLLKAFDPNAEISETNPAHLDVKVAFRVKDPNSNKYVIVNKAQISDDADENGNPIDDIDSKPDEWNEGEDDQDIENVSVEYFDLALLKYVTKVIVTDNGKTKTTNTGNTGADTDIMPKVEIHKNRVKTTVVKFEYAIKITNEGDIAGYAKEITDYVPEGLKFYAADNTGWKDEGNNVISTKLLENTLLQPGESATVKVILRWINGENNLQTKINIAEISEDYNDEKIPDRDSTPDNKKDGEDDIDDAPVILGIKTGMTENIMMYVGVSLVILTILGTGIILIKKFVL